MNRTSRKMGILAAWGAGICTVTFATSLIFGIYNLAYLVCLILSLFYMILTVCFKMSTSRDNVFPALAVAFAIMYSLLICIVYYVQITVVRLGNLPKESLALISYAAPGSAFFALDMLGYAFLCLSTLFIALSITKGGSILKILLYIHSLFAVSSFGFPLLPIIYKSDETNSATSFGLIALLIWCLLFAAICVGLERYFNQMEAE